MATNNYTKEECYRIANTIWLQLGSQRFSLLTGCKPVCYGEKDGKAYLLMTVGKNDRGINCFEVAYNEGKDLYEVRFIRKDGDTAKVIANYSEVYCDMLHMLFRQHTGINVDINVAA